MKTKLALLTFAMSALSAIAAGNPPDLTLAVASSFRAHMGNVIILRGRLEVGKQGYCLWGATPTNVRFYVIPDMPPSGTYVYPALWERFLHKQVRVKGELKFRSFGHSTTGSKVTTQKPPDYYYMVLERAVIEEVTTK